MSYTYQNFKLCFTGYAESWKGATATIVESPGDSVWGVLWEIAKDQEHKLDAQEKGYKPITITVNSQDNCELLCKSYQKLPVLDGCCEPSLVYKTVMIHGAKEHQLPLSYIQDVEAFKDNGYRGTVDIPVNIDL